MTAAYVYDAVRTPFGRYGGGLAGERPDDLGAHVVRALVDRAPDVDPARIDDVLFGNANGAGEDNRDVGRMAVLLAGLPTSVPGTSVNRLCGSSLDAAMQASRMVETGDASLALAGGVESMSRAPWVMLKPERAFPAADGALHSTTLGWRMVNPRMPERWTISLGQSTERLAGRYGISREAQDAFALRSHRLAAAAWDAGFYDGWVVPVAGTDLQRDESLRPDTSGEALARLKPAFAADGTVTAGNSSPLNDGASAVFIGDERAAALLGREPLARIAGRGATRSIPTCSASPRSRPPSARWRAPDRLGRSVRGRAQRGVRGAVARVPGRLERARPGDRQSARRRDRDRHPLGASGTRILGTLAHELRSRGGGYGLAAICIGVGQGLAVVLDA